MNIDEIKRNAPDGANYYCPDGPLNVIYIRKSGNCYEIWNNFKQGWISGSTTFNLMKEFSPNLKPLN